MAKINILIPEPQDPYTVNNFRQINQSVRDFAKSIKYFLSTRFKRRVSNFYYIYD
jgi:hypothetical protein